jgi:hypothetical protein
MKVRMKTISAGPDGTVQAGEVVELPAKLARVLIDEGFAEAVETLSPGPSPKGRGESEVEAAVVEAEETATKPKAKPRRGRKKSTGG